MQPDNTEHISFRYNVEHELIIAVLTAGPVGFGDSLPHKGFEGTNTTRLLLASRADGVILKAAHTALELDANEAIWVAPSVPSRAGESAGTDRRANSRARLIATDGAAESPHGRWWYTLLATDVFNTNGSSALKGYPLYPSQLFPVPPPSLVFVSTTFGSGNSSVAGSSSSTPCINGAAASSCLSALSSDTPLDVHTEPCTKRWGGCRNWKVLNVAPVLNGGWVVVGEQGKYVAVSPQRMIAASAPAGSFSDSDGPSDALHEEELGNTDGAGVGFEVVGMAGETLDITVVAPASSINRNNSQGGVDDRLALAMEGKVIVVPVKLGASGKASIKCSGSTCTASAA